MKRELFALACLLPMPTCAANLPIHDTYCGDEFIITPTGLTLDFYYFCTATGPARRHLIPLACTYGKGYESEGAPFTTRASFTEDRAAGTLTYTEEGEDPVTLYHCDSSLTAPD